MANKIPHFELSAAIDLMNKDQNKAAMLILERYPDDAECQARMAEIIYGDSSEPNRKLRAFELYQRAADQGNPNAYFHLAYFYENGIGVETSLEHAKAWYLKCIDFEGTDGMSRLAGLYLRGVDGAADYVQAYRYYYIAYISNGHPKDLEHMKDMLHCMTNEQHERALSLADDWIAARYKLHIKGLDQNIDLVLQTEEDFKYLTGNCDSSMTLLQVKQVLGLIKSGQFDRATEILQPNIEDALGQYLLGMVNYSDKTRHSGKRDSIPFFTEAATKGCPVAFFRLAYCFADGEGVDANVQEAVKWYTKAAMLGDSVAQHNLAQLHYRCVDLPRDYISAYKWFFLSLAHGCKAAERQYIGLVNKLNSQEQDEAWKAVEACVEKVYEVPLALCHPDHRRFSGKTSVVVPMSNLKVERQNL